MVGTYLEVVFVPSTSNKPTAEHEEARRRGKWRSGVGLREREKEREPLYD